MRTLGSICALNSNFQRLIHSLQTDHLNLKGPFLIDAISIWHTYTYVIDYHSVCRAKNDNDLSYVFSAKMSGANLTLQTWQYDKTFLKQVAPYKESFQSWFNPQFLKMRLLCWVSLLLAAALAVTAEFSDESLDGKGVEHIPGVDERKAERLRAAGFKKVCFISGI